MSRKPPLKLPAALNPKIPRSRVSPEGRIHAHLVVSDMKRSIDFYTTRLGFFYDHGIKEAAWLTHRHLLLTLSPGTPLESSSAYFGWCAQSPEQLEEYYASFYKSGCRLSAPPDLAGARSYFFLYDPDDYPIVFSYQPFDYPEIYSEEDEAAPAELGPGEV